MNSCVGARPSAMRSAGVPRAMLLHLQPVPRFLTPSAPLFRRYEKHWLPLLAKHSAEPSCSLDAVQLVPPVDVGWCWLVHRLAPEAYVEDCATLFGEGRVIDGQLWRGLDYPNANSSHPDVRHSMAVWAQFVHDEPYAPPGASGRGEAPAFTSAIAYDLAAAIERQVTFNYQVAAP